MPDNVCHSLKAICKIEISVGMQQLDITSRVLRTALSLYAALYVTLFFQREKVSDKNNMVN